MSKKISRADFLKTSAAGLAAMTVVPGNVMGSAFGHKAPSDKLNIAGVGIGGRGSAVLDDLKEENIVALCDTDWNYAKGTFDRFSKAQRFWDWREMYDKVANQIDAVMCATPDHTHALVAANAMELGKHVYCEKPLTHSVYESRLLTKLAAKNGVATQMGNQGSSGEGVQKVCDWIWNGEIGEVTRVDAFTDRPIWPQGLMRPSQVDPIPETLNWDLFLGSAPYRPYNKIYQPWNWRGWWDFGTGALGDMACHILHPVFKALQLGYPTKVQGSSTALLTDCAPQAQMVTYVFPERGKKDKVKLPEVTVTWYDGGLTPPRPEGLEPGKNLNDGGGGCIFYGTKDVLICGCYGVNPYLLSGRVPNAPARARKVEQPPLDQLVGPVDEKDHERNGLAAGAHLGGRGEGELAALKREDRERLLGGGRRIVSRDVLLARRGAAPGDPPATEELRAQRLRLARSQAGDLGGVALGGRGARVQIEGHEAEDPVEQ